MKSVLFLLLAPALFVVPLSAHHSFAKDYDESQIVSIEGDLVQFDYQNPHSVITINVADERGQLQAYTAEWGGANRLKRDGITTATFKAGDHLVLRGSPGRKAEERRIHLKGIHRPADGWTWGRLAPVATSSK